MKKGNSLVVQWLGLLTPTAGGTVSIPSWKTQAALWGQEKKKQLFITYEKLPFFNIEYLVNVEFV